MGWWGHDIMGGDTPLDVTDCFNDELVGTYTPTAAVAFIETLGVRWGCEHEIIAQCVGWLILSLGLPIDEELRALIIEGCDKDRSGEWIEKEEREKHIANLRSLVQTYPLEGRPIDVD